VLGYRLETNASTALTFSACKKPMIIRCPNLSDRASARVRDETNGAPSAATADASVFSILRL
jgi:hypothetical protein